MFDPEAREARGYLSRLRRPLRLPGADAFGEPRSAPKFRASAPVCVANRPRTLAIVQCPTEGRRGEARDDDDNKAKHDSPARKRSIPGSGDDAA